MVGESVDIKKWKEPPLLKTNIEKILLKKMFCIRVSTVKDGIVCQEIPGSESVRRSDLLDQLLLGMVLGKLLRIFMLTRTEPKRGNDSSAIIGRIISSENQLLPDLNICVFCS